MTASTLKATLEAKKGFGDQFSIKNRTHITVFSYILLTLIYLALVWFLPPNRSSLDKYNISELEGKLLGLTFVLPLVGVWFSALYGYLRFRAYALLIRTSPEGPSFKYLADGLMILAFGLPFSSIISSLFNYYSARNPQWLATTTILRNYSDIVIYFSAFAILYIGARNLYKSLRVKQQKDEYFLKYNIFITITVSTVFAWLLIANPINAGAGSSDSIYYLPNWLVIFTIAIPYLFSWYFGSMASYWLLKYQKRVTGKMYKQPFNNLAKGIAVIVFDAMLIRFIASLSPRLERLNLTPLLLIIYVLVLLYILGYGLVARGAKGLKKIEEV